ncbi:MAG: murein biosynthesis integral membrane protein MurJ [Candidatus Dormibacteria bacterium]
MSAEDGIRRTGRHSDRAIFRQSGLTGVAAMAGVIAGLILDIAIAWRFGAGAKTDEFFVAARIPIGLVAVITAAANQALVPAFRTSMTQRGERSTDRLISMVIAVVVIVGAALVLLTWLVAGPFVHITAPGLPVGEVSTAASMVPVMFAMIPLVAVAEVMRAYLNARYAFVAPALMTVVLNGLAAAMIIVLPILGWKAIFLVAIAFVSGAAAQLVFMCAMAVRNGLRLRPELDLGDEQLRSVGKLCIRPLGAAGLNPVARLGEQLVVSFLPIGSISVLNYGFLINSAVGGTVFFRSVIVALVPRLTDAHNLGGHAEVRRVTGLGVRIMLAISLPLTAFMAVLGKPAAVAVFHRGQFVLPQAELLGTVLIVYSISLIGQAMQRALLAPFYARLDTRTPLRNALYGLVANLVLLPLLVLPFGLHNRNAIIGVALAYSLAQYVNAGHAWYRLTHTDGNPLRGVLPFAIRLVIASALSATAMIGASLVLNLGEEARNSDRVQLLIRTPIAGVVGLAVLLAAMYLLAGGEIRNWRTLLRRRPPLGGGDGSATIVVDDQAGSPGPETELGDGPGKGTQALEENTPIAANLP